MLKLCCCYAVGQMSTLGSSLGWWGKLIRFLTHRKQRKLLFFCWKNTFHWSLTGSSEVQDIKKLIYKCCCYMPTLLCTDLIIRLSTSPNYPKPAHCFKSGSQVALAEMFWEHEELVLSSVFPVDHEVWCGGNVRWTTGAYYSSTRGGGGGERGMPNWYVISGSHVPEFLTCTECAQKLAFLKQASTVTRQTSTLLN